MTYVTEKDGKFLIRNNFRLKVYRIAAAILTLPALYTIGLFCKGYELEDAIQLLAEGWFLIAIELVPSLILLACSRGVESVVSDEGIESYMPLFGHKFIHHRLEPGVYHLDYYSVRGDYTFRISINNRTISLFSMSTIFSKDTAMEQIKEALSHFPGFKAESAGMTSAEAAIAKSRAEMTKETGISIPEASEELMKSLGERDCIFKCIPDDIGKIVYCNTSKNQKKANIGRSLLFSLLWVVIVAVIGIYIIGVLPDNRIVGLSFLALMAVAVVAGWIYIFKFEGDDYFVGTNGCATVHFKWSRSHVRKEVIMFSDVQDVDFKEEDVLNEGAKFTETKYSVTIYGKGSGKPVIKQIDSSCYKISKEHKDTVRYLFWKRVAAQLKK